MRKGRSSRRGGRVSRPLVGVKGEGEALSTELPSDAPPRVVVSVPPSDVPSDYPPSEPPRDSVQARGSDSLSPLDPLAALERLEKPASLASTIVEAPPPRSEEDKKDFASTMVFGSFVTFAEDRRSRPPKDLASTVAFGSQTPASPSVALAAPVVAPPVVQAAAAPSAPEPVLAVPVAPVKVEDAPLPLPRPVVESPPKIEEAPQTVASAKIEPAANSVDPDEVSVPPIGDLAADRFFTQGDQGVDDDDEEEILDKAKRKADPAVVERRARFGRYVKWSVAVAGIVCLAAVGRTALVAKPAPAALARPSVTNDAPPVAKAAVPAVAPIPDPPKVEAKEPAEAAEPNAKPDESRADPIEEKRAAQRFLEKRKLAEAIAAGERSVAADPTDGEAWLILGAAYQEKGSMTDARRAYGSCVKEATKGPRAECAKMLR